MLKSIRDWLEDRTGLRKLLVPIRRRILPNGPSWGYTTANCVLWLLIIEVVTGFLLMGSYSPSTSSAWASVHFIEQAKFGAFIRGLHYWCAQAMLVLFIIHTIRVLLAAAFRAPRELIWITGLLLIPMFVLWAITGNPLSGTQTGASQIEVEGNIIGSTPIVGPIIQRLLIGGEEVGSLTLTHLYFLHVGLFPLAVGILLAIHIAQVYRHGSSEGQAEGNTKAARPYFPDQTIRNLTVLTMVLATIVVLSFKYGAPLDAPADPELAHSPRPEWYFLFLFELRAYFVGKWEFIATMVIPLVAMLVLLAMPILDRICSPRVSAVLRYSAVTLGVIAWAGLTLTSVWRDRDDKEHQATVAQFAKHSHRARQLADLGAIPPEGAVTLLRNDPQTQGPKLFDQHCASCHSYVDVDKDGKGIKAEKSSAPNLYGFANRKWIAGMLDSQAIVGEHYFGNTLHKDRDDGAGMVEWVRDNLATEDMDDDEKAELQSNLDKMIVALSAEAKLPLQGDSDATATDDGTVEAGRDLLVNEFSCIDCHKFHDEGDLGSAPDLTGYGSAEWLRGFLADPAHERFYGEYNDRMPSYANNHVEPSQNLLSAHEIDMLVRWLRDDDPLKSADKASSDE